MNGTGDTVERIMRAEAIERLRSALLAIAEEGTSLCAALGREGLCCHGLARWSRAELAERVRAATGVDVDPARAAEAADRLQLRRQVLAEGLLPCDGASPHRGDLCWGWDEFYGGELGRFLTDLTGAEVRVRDDAAAGCF